jgi:hypothetical protein
VEAKIALYSIEFKGFSKLLSSTFKAWVQAFRFGRALPGTNIRPTSANQRRQGILGTENVFSETGRTNWHKKNAAKKTF